jgi:hypothetical protein
MKTVTGVLKSRPAQKIDFHLGLIHVDAMGLTEIATYVASRIIRIKVEPIADPDVAAQYLGSVNTLHFSREDYGANADERRDILHECVHALHDMHGAGYYHPSSGSRFMTEVENEAAAYVAGSLYELYETGTLSATSNPAFTNSDLIAKRIGSLRGAYVSTAELDALRIAILSRKTYRHLSFTTPTSADGP